MMFGMFGGNPVVPALLRFNMYAPNLFEGAMEPSKTDADPDVTTLIQATYNEVCLFVLGLYLANEFIDFTDESINIEEMMEKLARAAHRLVPCGNPNCEFNHDGD